MSGVLRNRRKFRHRYTGRTSCEDKGRDSSDVSTSWGTPRVSDNHQKLGKRHGTDSPSEPPGGTSPANTLVRNSSLQNCERINHCCFNQGKPWETNALPHIRTLLPPPPLWPERVCVPSPPPLLCFIYLQNISSNAIFPCRKPSLIPLTPRLGLPAKHFMILGYNISTASQKLPTVCQISLECCSA